MTVNVLLDCKNIWKLYGAKANSILDTHVNPDINTLKAEGIIGAVRAVNVQIMQGEIFVIMGLSGSGKSTLVRCLSRLVEPTTGSIKFDGVDLLKATDSELIEIRRKKMGMVFQQFALLPHLTTIENVAFPLDVQGVKKDVREARALDVIELVGLKGRENYYPRQLSGGQQQRVGIARSLVVEPDLWFLDEPFSALDPLIRREMQDELLKIQEKLQRTMVFITHDFLEAIKMGDHIAIMKDGEISQIGTPEEIVSNPKDQYVKDFCEDVPKYKVLSAGKVMRKECCAETKKQFEKKENCIEDNSKIETLIDQLSDRDQAYPVICSTSGKLLGEIDRSIVMQSMKSKV